MQDKIELVKDKIFNAAQVIKLIPLERIILGAFSVLCIGLLFYQFIIAAQINRLKAIDFQFNSQKRLLDFYNNLVIDKNSIVEEKKEKERALMQIQDNFVSEDELSSYFENFRALVKSTNLEVLSLDFKPQENPREFGGRQYSYMQILPLSVSVRGEYFSIMSLLYKLEESKSFFDIVSLQIMQDNLGAGGLVMNIEASIYIFKKI